MSHHHDDHHHEGHGHHTHSHDQQSSLTFQEKMIKLLEHWIKHNQDHANTYTDWAAKAEDEKMVDVANLLKEAATMNQDINIKFEAALKQIKKS
jgi:rubrerythrin